MVILRENNDEFLERGGGGDFSTSPKSATFFSETRAGGSKGVFFPKIHQNLIIRTSLTGPLVTKASLESRQKRDRARTGNRRGQNGNATTSRQKSQR